MAESDNASEISSDESDVSEENESEQSSDHIQEPVTPGSCKRRSTRLDNYMNLIISSSKVHYYYSAQEEWP